jgi:hypothetical protein
LVRQACCFEALYATNAGPKSWCSIPGHKTDKCQEHWAFEQSAYQKCWIHCRAICGRDPRPIASAIPDSATTRLWTANDTDTVL